MSRSSPQSPSHNAMNLPGKLTTNDPDTYIVVCLHCLNYFRSLPELLRHRLLNHNILDNVATGETLPRVSKDGSWLVAGGGSDPPNTYIPTQPMPTPSTAPPLPSGIRTPSGAGGMPTPSPPPLPIQVPQFRSLGPHHHMQASFNQFQNYSATPPPQNRPIQPNMMHPPAASVSPGSPFRPAPHFHPQQQYFTPQTSASPSPTPQVRPPNTTNTATIFSPAAKEFVPSSFASKGAMRQG